MIKQNKWKLIFTSIATLIPIIIGLVIWNELPDTIATHWGINGEPDKYSSKAFAVFGLPLLLFVIHWICVFATKLDPKGKNINTKMFAIVLWICPGISIVMNTLVYLIALGKEIRFVSVVIIFMGLLFILIGNYLPKCRQSYTMGIKLPWTLNDEENWNKTHRMAGALWVIGGIILCATAIFESFIIFFSIVLVMVIVPTVYSYMHYRKNK